MGDEASSLSSSSAAGHLVHLVVQKSMTVGVPLNALLMAVNSAVARLVSG